MDDSQIHSEIEKLVAEEHELWDREAPGDKERLEQDWPGLRDRLVEPGPRIRPHIHFYVDRERAGLETPIQPGSRVEVIAAISGG